MTSQLSQLKTAITDLEKATRQLDEKNGKLQSKFLLLTIMATIFTVAQVVQVIDIICRWIGKCN